MTTKFALVIDDSATMRAMVSQTLLQETDIDDVITADNPDQALEKLASAQGELQYIVSDWNMPGMPVPDFMEILESTPATAVAPFFLLTSSEQSKRDEIAATIHPTAMLTKPFNPAQLIALIATHVGISERRRAPRVVPLSRCEVDFGFDQGTSSYHADVINISEIGVLLRAHVSSQNHTYVYDFVSLNLQTNSGSTPIKLYGQIIRLEADGETAQKNTIKIAIDFRAMRDENRRVLQQYVGLNMIDSAEGH